MIHRLSPNVFSAAAMLALTAAIAFAQPETATKITLRTEPAPVAIGQKFELIWSVTPGEGRVEKVFLDCADAFGPEHHWEHKGVGVFESRIQHVEQTAGLKEYELWAKIRKGEKARFVGESFKIKVAAKNGDQDLQDFLSWMKQVGYSDEVIQVYVHDGANPVVREYWDKYFAMRNEEMAYRDLETMPVLFVDVAATDDEATNKLLGDETGKLEDYLTKMFGKAFKLEYLKLPVSYEEEFGKALLQGNAKGAKWVKFNPLALNAFARETAKRLIEERDLPPNSVIIHWAPDRWMHEGKSLKVQDHTGSGPALSGMDFGGFGIATYAHEWGHGLGLGHMFIDGPGSFESRAWGLDCVMNHTYVPYTNKQVGRLLSPLPRYALEPTEGYIDQKGFAAAYSEAMAGTEHIERRLNELKNGANSVISTMDWSTPWKAAADDSVFCEGFANRNYMIPKLRLNPKIGPGIYTLQVADSGRGPSRMITLFKDGEKVVSTPFAWLQKISHQNHHEITIEDYLTFTVGRTSERGGSTMAGLGQLINGKPLVVADK